MIHNVVLMVFTKTGSVLYQKSVFNFKTAIAE